MLLSRGHTHRDSTKMGGGCQGPGEGMGDVFHGDGFHFAKRKVLMVDGRDGHSANVLLKW